MRTLFLLSILPFIFAASQLANSPAATAMANPAAIEPFIPKNFTVLKIAEGRLNTDSETDYAVVVERAASATQSAARRLLVILTDPEVEGGLKIAQQYWRFIPLPVEGDDPFSQLMILDGALEVQFKPPNAGRSHVTYTFKPEGRRFVLSRLQRYTVKPTTGMFKETLIHLEQGEREFTSGSMSSPRHLKKLEKFKPEQTWTPCRIDDPLNFEP